MKLNTKKQSVSSRLNGFTVQNEVNLQFTVHCLIYSAKLSLELF